MKLNKFLYLLALGSILGCEGVQVKLNRQVPSAAIAVEPPAGEFSGAVGNITASTGNCPVIGAASSWCLGGTFASGAGDGMFNTPTSVAVDTDNNFLYIADSQNHRVVKLELSTGEFVGAIGNLTATSGTCPAAGAAPGWCSGGTFGSGAGDGMFNKNRALDIDVDNDRLYVSDMQNQRVQKFVLSTGVFIGAIGNTSSSVGTCPGAGATNAWCTGGTFAAGAVSGMFSSPRGVSVDRTNQILYLADSGNHRVQKINADTGAFIGAIGNTSATSGTCPAAGVAPGWCTGGTFATAVTDGAFSTPREVVIDVLNNALYTLEAINRIQKFTLTTGAYVGSVGNLSATVGSCPASGAASGWCTGGTFAVGAGDGMFNNALDLSVDSSNDFLYVSDSSNNRTVKLNSDTGAFIGSMGNTTSSAGTCPASGAATTWCTGGTFAAGTGDGMLSGPLGLGVDEVSGQLYLSDTGNHRIVKVE